jgi:hypothetical protein
VALLRPAPFGGRAFAFRSHASRSPIDLPGSHHQFRNGRSQTMARRFNRTAHNGLFDDGRGDNDLGRGFVSALKADFARHGASRIRKLRKQQPCDYLKLVASLLPQASSAGAVQALPSSTEDEFARELEILRAFAEEYDKARSASKG